MYTSRLVIGTSRTVGSAKKFVRITSGFGGEVKHIFVFDVTQNSRKLFVFLISVIKSSKERDVYDT
jgi:hypothetical protein